jgi:hypothetical protein
LSILELGAASKQQTVRLSYNALSAFHPANVIQEQINA